VKKKTTKTSTKATTQKKSKASPKRKEKSKKKKDPNAPKKAMTPYLAYLKERRPDLKKEQPNLKPTEFVTTMADEWKAFSSDKKQKYEKMANKDKERYQKEMANYKAPENSSSSDDESPKSKKGKGKGKKKEKDPNAPKRPMTPYFIYLGEQRANAKKDNANAGVTQLAKILSEKWNNMSEAEKKPYKDKHEKDKKRYEAEKADYEKK